MAIYAPIVGWSASKEGNAISGVAWPDNGPFCCAIALVSSNRMLAAIRADLYSSTAAKNKIRDGWCGFSIDILPEYFLFSDQIEFRCLATGKLLEKFCFDVFEFDESGISRNQGPIPIDVDGTLKDQELLSFLPLVRRLSGVLDDERYVEFLYRFLFAREPDHVGQQTQLSMLRNGVSRETLYKTLVGSSEFLARKSLGIRSPFDESFPVAPKFEPTQNASVRS